MCPNHPNVPAVRRNRLRRKDGSVGRLWGPYVCLACYWRYRKRGTFEKVGYNRAKVDPIKKSRARRLLKNGESARYVAKSLGMCTKTVRRIRDGKL